MKKELQSVKKDLNALAKRLDKLIAAAAKVETKPKKKAAKKTAPKKAAQKAAPKKTVTKAAPKKAEKVTASDTVLKIIQRLKNGTDTAGLMKKTGFDQKKVSNIIFKLKKQGKITSPKKGLYVKA